MNLSALTQLASHAPGIQSVYLGSEAQPNAWPGAASFFFFLFTLDNSLNIQFF